MKIYATLTPENVFFQVLQQHGPQSSTVRSWPVIGQFSSIGSMGAGKQTWLCAEWKQSLGTCKGGGGLGGSQASLKLVRQGVFSSPVVCLWNGFMSVVDRAP